MTDSISGYIKSGKIYFKSENITSLNERKMRKIRAEEIAYIFQEPLTALNPVFTIGEQIVDVIRSHKKISSSRARDIAIGLLTDVNIKEPVKCMKEFPHHLSGGMRQRVMIAMALSCRPILLIADEPTSAVDMTTQAQVLALLDKLHHQERMSLILISHDFGIIADHCKTAAVMYCGKIVEEGPIEKILKNPRHPYTKGLLESSPKIRKEKLPILPTIEGKVPDLFNLPEGCVFSDRCPNKKEVCQKNNPSLQGVAKRRFACFFPV
jgi:oligopeptide/dipeptide ABC transporter ATP-binding protein